MSPEDEAKMTAMIRPNGSLYDWDRCVEWDAASARIVVDGSFTPDELRWIANYFERGANAAKRNTKG